MKAFWAGLAFLMSISSAQSCQIDSKASSSFADLAKVVLIGNISQHVVVKSESLGRTSEYVRFLVVPKQSFSGKVKEPFWAVSRATAWFNAPDLRQGDWLMAFTIKKAPHLSSASKKVRQLIAGYRLVKTLQDPCSSGPAIFRPQSPKAQAIIEILRKQTEAEQ